MGSDFCIVEGRATFQHVIDVVCLERYLTSRAPNMEVSDSYLFFVNPTSRSQYEHELCGFL
jgi:hypothetical protein